MSRIRNLAAAVDAAIANLDAAAGAYLAEARRLHSQHMETQAHRKARLANPLFESPGEHVKLAVRGRHELARALGIAPGEPCPVAARHE